MYVSKPQQHTTNVYQNTKTCGLKPKSCYGYALYSDSLKIKFFCRQGLRGRGVYFRKFNPLLFGGLSLPTYLPTLIASKPIPSLLELPTPATTTAAVVKQYGINPKDK